MNVQENKKKEGEIMNKKDNVLAELSAIEQAIHRYCWGERLFPDEIGKILGCSAEAVGQMIIRIARKIS